MKFFKKTAATVLTAAALLGGGVAVAGPAAAADCVDWNVCLWDGTNWGGAKNSAAYDTPWIGDWANDRAESNLVGCQAGATFYQHINYGGYAVYFGPCGWYNNLNSLTAGRSGWSWDNWGNDISGHRAGNH